MSEIEEPYLEPGTFVLVALDLLGDSVDFALRADTPLEWIDVLGKMKEFCRGAKEVVEGLVGHTWDYSPAGVHALQLEMVAEMGKLKTVLDGVRADQQRREDLEVLRSQILELQATFMRMQGENG
jgi:hypothetical protein